MSSMKLPVNTGPEATSPAGRPEPQGPAEETDRTSKRYWKSLDRLYDSPALAGGSDEQSVFEEFLPGASERPDAMSRRTMMGLMGATFALAGTTGCRRPEQKIIPYVDAPEGRLPGVPEHFATTAMIGTSAYGLVVESHDGRPTKVEGNELHPASRGAADAWTQASVLELYDPDRSRSVLRRGEEDGSHQAATWEEIQPAWNGLIGDARGDGGARMAVISDGHCSPTRARLSRAFLESFPSATWVVHEPVHDENLFSGIESVTGQALRPVYHLEKAKVILSLDSDFLGT